MPERDNWGWRARFGLFIVSSEAVPEAEWWAMMPPGTSVHAARVEAPAPWANWQDEKNPGKLTLSGDLARGARHFSGMRLDAVVIGHSSSSILGGPGWDEAVVRELRKVLPAQVHLSTNGLDCQAALRASRVKHPFLVFPPWFNDATIEAGEQYFDAHDFQSAGYLRIDPGRRWRDLPHADLYPQGMGFEQDVESLYRQVHKAMPQEADGVLIVGTGLRCVAVCEALEQDLARPVVTANQASLWQCLRTAGISPGIRGYGKLLASG